PQAFEGLEIAAQGTRIWCDHDAALTEHRIAAEHDVPETEGQMVRSVTGRGDRLQRPEPLAVAEPHRHAPTRSGDQSGAEPFEHLTHPLGVIVMVVSESDPPESATRRDLGHQLI